jgi:hypothetical protein
MVWAFKTGWYTVYHLSGAFHQLKAAIYTSPAKIGRINFNFIRSWQPLHRSKTG